MAIDRDEFEILRTRARLTYAQLGSRIGRSERTVSTWGSKTHGGVPDKYEAVVRDALAPAGEPGNPLEAYSDYALLDELARRLRRSAGERSTNKGKALPEGLVNEAYDSTESGNNSGRNPRTPAQARPAAGPRISPDR